MPPKTTNGYDRKRLGAEIRANTYLTGIVTKKSTKMPSKTTNGYDRKRLGAEIRANTYLTELLQRNRQK